MSAFLGGRGDKTTQKLKDKTSLSRTTTYLKNIRGKHQTNKDSNTRKTEKKYGINKVQNKQKQKLLFSGLGKFSSHDPATPFDQNLYPKIIIGLFLSIRVSEKTSDPPIFHITVQKGTSLYNTSP